MQFEILGDLRFLSHHDSLRLFERAAVRGGLPLKYSMGFNPNPRLSMPLPRTVGMAGRQEWLLVQLTEPLEPADLCRRLAAALPREIRVRQCWRCPGNESWQAHEAVYDVPLGGAAIADLPDRIQRLLAADSAVLHRDMGPAKRGKSVDARPFIAALEVSGGRLQMRLGFVQGATVRPSEVLELLGLPAQPYASRVTRTSIAWGPRNLIDGHVPADPSQPVEESRDT